jgi:hypothetical protein
VNHIEKVRNMDKEDKELLEWARKQKKAHDALIKYIPLVAGFVMAFGGWFLIMGVTFPNALPVLLTFMVMVGGILIVSTIREEETP